MPALVTGGHTVHRADHTGAATCGRRQHGMTLMPLLMVEATQCIAMIMLLSKQQLLHNWYKEPHGVLPKEQQHAIGTAMQHPAQAVAMV